jgi:hypothetical protein
MSDLEGMLEEFVDNWAPKIERDLFIRQLRLLLETYGRAALRHESLPETEHGDPV